MWNPQKQKHCTHTLVSVRMQCCRVDDSVPQRGSLRPHLFKDNSCTVGDTARNEVKLVVAGVACVRLDIRDHGRCCDGLGLCRLASNHLVQQVEAVIWDCYPYDSCFESACHLVGVGFVLVAGLRMSVALLGVQRPDGAWNINDIHDVMWVCFGIVAGPGGWLDVGASRGRLSRGGT